VLIHIRHESSQLPQEDKIPRELQQTPMSFGNPKQTIKVVDNYEVQQEKTNETYKMKSPTLIVQKSSLSHIQKAGQLSWYKSEKVSKTPN
jgi:hypothetical protein